MAAEDCETLQHEASRDPVDRMVRERLALPVGCGKSAEEVFQELSAREWVPQKLIELATQRCSTPSPISTSFVGAIAQIVQMAIERENIVERLSQQTTSYGLKLPNELKVTMSRVDTEGSLLFQESVAKCRSLLSAFDGPSCHDLGRALLAGCLRKGTPSVQPEAVNEYLTKGPRVSRHCRAEFNPKVIFDMAITHNWMHVTDRRHVKEYICRKPHVAWPIMHALKAIYGEINSRARVIRELTEGGAEVPQSIYVLKDVVSRAASNQFVRLVDEVRCSLPIEGRARR
jgi:hypothetical protein